jgi:hypothetical protein
MRDARDPGELGRHAEPRPNIRLPPRGEEFDDGPEVEGLVLVVDVEL